MFQQLIFNEQVHPFQQSLANSYASQILEDRQVQPFTFDYKKIKNKMCFGEMIEKPKEITRNHKALIIYVDDYFKGIRASDYGHAVSRLIFHQQKISNLQEIDPLNSEKKNIFQEKELPVIKIEQIPLTSCQKCQSNKANQYYEIEKRDMCEECALHEYSDQLTKYKLGKIQAKRESKGLKYEQKLQKYYEKVLKDLKSQNQVVLNLNLKADQDL